MKPSILAGLTLLGTSHGLHMDGILFASLHNKAVQKVRPTVPGYTFTMPVDHFDSSNRDTFQNRYFVNDTYYKPGGPVIFFDVGESSLSPTMVAEFLAEHNMTSAPLRLAAKTNGLVIGWEHRYYGFSRPVPMNDTSGLPRDELEGYRYLTIEQGLQDTAYFANNFNKTTLSSNSNVKDTANLGPSQTPWIFLGGSYAGMRAAWARAKYPEVFYASWSSSAPLQTQEDGSVYYNPIVRSMPRNCSNDIKAAVKYVDQTLSSGSAAAVEQVKRRIYRATQLDADGDEMDNALLYTGFDITGALTYALSFGGVFQNLGAYQSSRVMCDLMEAFDVDAFKRGSSAALTVHDQNKALFNNSGNVAPTRDGVAAKNGRDGGMYAFAALVYAMYHTAISLDKYSRRMTPGSGSETAEADHMSWAWQSLSQMGFFQGSNPSNVSVISKFYNVSAVREIQVKGQTFGAIPATSLPRTIKDTNMLALGGWNFTGSNIMFTNGEFDPWRAFSVSSQEAGAPNRRVVETVPDCDMLPEDNGVFGLVYHGAVHVEDLATRPYQRGSVESSTPLDQGLQLFLRAWDKWQPCFNRSSGISSSRLLNENPTRKDHESVGVVFSAPDTSTWTVMTALGLAMLI
ncbi:hypothetical protein ED733_000543 [Metarhizium rileyi]|uniref:Peptidase S28 n=1 Tax=Metarhizium rileyi (strain RCEF 4871) TaxID=1649241 RepID=A0A5C6G2F8_METRR|nr:hypothetical protein ED733_000543 [Metarhizium rileyi]